MTPLLKIYNKTLDFEEKYSTILTKCKGKVSIVHTLLYPIGKAMTASKTYQMRLPPSLYRNLLLLALKTRKPRAIIIKTALKKYVEEELKKDVPDLYNERKRYYS